MHTKFDTHLHNLWDLRKLQQVSDIRHTEAANIQWDAKVLLVECREVVNPLAMFTLLEE